MDQHEFRNYRKYAHAQIRHTRRKSRRRKIRCFTHPRIAAAAAVDYGGRPLDLCICHGVRTGAELDMFSAAFGGGQWIGTEITPELCDGKRIMERDFSKTHPEWLDTVDVLYTNSFDHSRDPTATAVAWVSCLRPKTGRLYVEWTKWHSRLGKRGNKADCFAATADEYRSVFESVGTVERVLTVGGFIARKNGREYERNIIVVSQGIKNG